MHLVAISIQSQEEFTAAARRLRELKNVDAPRAIVECRQLRGTGNFKLPVLGMGAAILVDAGNTAKDREAVLEGVKTFRRLNRAIKENWKVHYNLANGLSGLVRLTKCPHPEWHASTGETRREARLIFQTVIQKTQSSKLRAKASINLGNELDAGYRRVEAYDRWATVQTEAGNVEC